MYADHGETLITQRVLNVTAAPTTDDNSGLRNNIFHTKYTAKGKACNVIIDSGSCENMVATSMVEKLGLKAENHPSPYQLTWLKKGNVVKVTKRYLVHFSIGNKYTDDVWCEVITMDACHILLGRPWQYDRKAKHDGFRNTYRFSKDGVHVTLASFDTRPSSVDFLILTKSEFVGLTKLNQNTLLFTLVLQEANKLELVIPEPVQRLLTEFQDVFPDEIPPGLPLM